MTAPLPPVWIAAAPEVHSTLLNFGGTPEGIIISGASWADLGAQYMAAMAELEAILAQAASTYIGPSSAQFVAAHAPMLVWFGDAAAKSAIAADMHATIADSYAGAVATMPTLGELAENHTVHGVLVMTNFFGVNTIPIALNEADYVRMWILAADVMSGYDAATTLAVNSIPLTPVSPIVLAPGVGEAGTAAATAAGMANIAQGQTAGVALTSADTMSDKLLAGKAATSPASAAGAASSTQSSQDANSQTNGQQALQPDSMMSGMLQQAASMGPSAAQSAASALQGGGPQQLLSSAPQMLSSAPQSLGQLLTQMTGTQGATTLGHAGATTLGQQASAMPVGFAGTAAMRGISPAGLTSLAGGAFGSGPARPLMPSTWGAASPAATVETAASSGRVLPVASGLASSSAPASAASGSGAGGAMMGAGAGAQARRASGSRLVSTYAHDAEEAAAEQDAEVRGRSP